MRLNLFLPFWNLTRGRPGMVRRVLATIGPSWAASPARRIIQTACLMLFLVLVFYVCWPQVTADYADQIPTREFIEAETFLALDPLVSLSTALATRAWIWSLTWAAALLGICLIIPSGFCGYVCPLGTLIDVFDWAIGKGTKRTRLPLRSWWIHLKYYLLAGTLVAAGFGVLLSGFVSAIPVVTRGMLFVAGPLQLGVLKGWYQVPPINSAQYVSIAMFCLIFAVSLLGRRFWCRCLCPTGALFSIASLGRLTRRKVSPDCTRCKRCIEACTFDAIREDFTTRDANCTFCQTCGGACPPRAIDFVGRWNRDKSLVVQDRSAGETALSRRGFLVGAAGGLAVALGIQKLFGAGLGNGPAPLPIRPPGSVPERQFLTMCVRCDLCLQACPSRLLRPLGFSQGLEGLWTPHAVMNWSGCAQSCNLCGQVCPTGAIRALPLAEKRAARMGLAEVNQQTCLPHAKREACRMCFDECKAAGYNAIEFIRVAVDVDEQGLPVADSGYDAPVILPDKCVGCGLCQARCYRINVLTKRLLGDSAICVTAGRGKEDRIMRGSYLALREAEAEQRRSQSLKTKPDASDNYLPDFLK